MEEDTRREDIGEEYEARETATGDEPGGEEGRAPGPDLAADLRELGENLRDTLRAAWVSQEREHLQAEIERGIKALGHAVNQTFDQATQDLRSRERVRERVAGARRKAAEMREEWRAERVVGRARAEVHEVLERLNEQLRRSRERWTARPEQSEGTAGQADETGGSPGTTTAAQ